METIINQLLFGLVQWATHIDTSLPSMKAHCSHVGLRKYLPLHMRFLTVAAEGEDVQNHYWATQYPLRQCIRSMMRRDIKRRVLDGHKSSVFHGVSIRLTCLFLRKSLFMIFTAYSLLEVFSFASRTWKERTRHNNARTKRTISRLVILVCFGDH